MSNAHWDTIIVGQGLAGTTLAWHLHEAGQRVLLIDACEAVTSSKVAAGLITPITGQRLALSRQFDEFMPVARDFYKRIEGHTRREFFHEQTALRFFKSDAERQRWSVRSKQREFRNYVSDPQPEPLIDPALADASGGGFAMLAAQLDVAAFLEATRAVLCWEEMQLNWLRDVTFGGASVSVGDHQARLVVSCEGFAAAHNPYFSSVSFNAAKGDILTVRFHQPLPRGSLHRGIWIAPTSESDIFTVGSTYDWDRLDNVPSTAARSDIERRLAAFILVPYTVLDHRAAVRPIIRESRPLIGRHPNQHRLAYFNGLGSKGSLIAPWYARVLSDHLITRTALPPDMDVQKHV